MLLNIRLESTVEYGGTRERLAECLLAWAPHGRYRLAEDGPGRWVFRRGGFWSSLLVMWDVYSLPCQVEVVHLPLQGRVMAALTCTSWFHMETAGDRERLEAELGRLHALLCDPGTGRWDKIGEGGRGEGIEVREPRPDGVM